MLLIPRVLFYPAVQHAPSTILLHEVGVDIHSSILPCFDLLNNFITFTRTVLPALYDTMPPER